MGGRWGRRRSGAFQVFMEGGQKICRGARRPMTKRKKTFRGSTESEGPYPWRQTRLGRLWPSLRDHCRWTRSDVTRSSRPEDDGLISTLVGTKRKRRLDHRRIFPRVCVLCSRSVSRADLPEDSDRDNWLSDRAWVSNPRSKFSRCLSGRHDRHTKAPRSEAPRARQLASAGIGLPFRDTLVIPWPRQWTPSLPDLPETAGVR